MANVSYVSGDMKLVGEWTEAMVKEFNTIKESWASWNYNITVDDFRPGDTDTCFYANGRWAFENNLAWIGGVANTKDNQEIEPAYARLCAALQGKEETFIHIDFEEELDPVNRQSGTAKIFLQDGELRGELIGINAEWQDHSCSEKKGWDCDGSECIHGEPICENEWAKRAPVTERDCLDSGECVHEEADCSDEDWEELNCFEMEGKDCDGSACVHGKPICESERPDLNCFEKKGLDCDGFECIHGDPICENEWANHNCSEQKGWDCDGSDCVQ